MQFGLERFGNGFLVTDGHHNRVLQVTSAGAITELRTFDNVVPTGLDVKGDKIYMAEAGPVPHLAENGKAVSFRASGGVTEVASGAPLAVDVELSGNRVFAVSQGDFPEDAPEGSPAAPNTGALLKAKSGGFDVVADELNQPTSVEFIRDDAYVVTLPGEILRIDAD